MRRNNATRVRAAALLVPLALVLTTVPTPASGGDSVFERLKTPLEVEIEDFLAEVYQQDYFRTFAIAGEEVEVRMPFGMNYERDFSDWVHFVYWGGKGRPDILWDYIEGRLDSDGFRRYLEDISDPEPKVIHFNMPDESYEVLYDEALIESMRQTVYPSDSLAHIYYLKEEEEITQVDVYNYLYAISRVGLDCSGFTYNLLRDLAERYEVDLDEHFMEEVPEIAEHIDEAQQVPLFVGLLFFRPDGPHVEEIDDSIVHLRPGDILLFRGRGDEFVHSGMVQSIDYQEGIITYYQATDWAPLEQRGVHQSVIEFDPARPEVSLAHEDIIWHKGVHPAFPGEPAAGYLDTDADRYRETAVHSGGHVVRLIEVRDLIEQDDPLYYQNRFPADTVESEEE